jgi:hypothetical protein
MRTRLARPRGHRRIAAGDQIRTSRHAQEPSRDPGSPDTIGLSPLKLKQTKQKLSDLSPTDASFDVTPPF